MKTAFDPLQRLTTQESIRFVGSIGGVSTNAPTHFARALELFVGREVRTSLELASSIKVSSGATVKVATVSVEEAASLRLIAPIPSSSKQHRKFVLDDGGRVVNAMRNHRDWEDESRRNALFLRPMFEANGDYLLQAMVSIDLGGEPLECFRDLVCLMAGAKLQTVPETYSGSKWDAYRQSINSRRQTIIGEASTAIDGNLSLESMQKQKRKSSDALLQRLRAPVAESSNSLEPGARTKTLGHHFARCRAWLSALGLVETKAGAGLRLSRRGTLLLSYFKAALPSRPLSIPPSMATLSDCFRLEEEEVRSVWGVVINEDFWESATLSMEQSGSYSPSLPEMKLRFDKAFDAVRVQGITEAMLSPLRQALFFGFLWDGKPVRELSKWVIGDESIPALYPNEYGFGRNRQGRLAYLFRKSR